MKGIDLIAAVFAIALVAGTVWYNVRRSSRGENACGCGCKGCGAGKKDGPPH